VLGEALKATPPTVGVDFLFTDGEDYGNFDTMTDVLIGAGYYAEHILPDSAYRPMFAVLWDMVGDRSQQFLQEPNSRRFAPEVVDMVWDLAARMGYERVFYPASSDPINDDHIPLGEKGFRIIDVIDLAFPWHHTPHDTIDKVSAQSLEVVGRVALALIRQAEN
jgi:Zn-dependent M28 family amino/carboxypeptidase